MRTQSRIAIATIIPLFWSCTVVEPEIPRTVFTFAAQHSIQHFQTSNDTSQTLAATFPDEKSGRPTTALSVLYNGRRLPLNDTATLPWYGYDREAPFELGFGGVVTLEADGIGGDASFRDTLVAPSAVDLHLPLPDAEISQNDSLVIRWKASRLDGQRTYLTLRTGAIEPATVAVEDNGTFVVSSRVLKQLVPGPMRIILTRRVTSYGDVEPNRTYEVELTSLAEVIVELLPD